MLSTNTIYSGASTLGAPLLFGMHRFYQKTPQAQRFFLFKIGVLCLGLPLCVGFIFYWLSPYFLPLFFVLFMVSISVFAPFFDVPSLYKQGKLRYLSPLLLVEPLQAHRLKLHNGTLFDYFFTLKPSDSATARTRYVLQQQLKGLLLILDTYPPQTRIEATSVLLPLHTLRALGFQELPPHNLDRLLLYFNAPNLIVTRSFLKKKWAPPSFRTIARVEISLATLHTQRPRLEALLQRLTQ